MLLIGCVETICCLPTYHAVFPSTQPTATSTLHQKEKEEVIMSALSKEGR